MSIRVLCDRCKEEIKGENVGVHGYSVAYGNFIISVEVIHENHEQLDMCLPCLLQILNQKPKRKYVRKQKDDVLTVEIIDKAIKQLEE